jgi:hypothetical protein
MTVVLALCACEGSLQETEAGASEAGAAIGSDGGQVAPGRDGGGAAVSDRDAGSTTAPAPSAACGVARERVRITEVHVGSTVVNDESEAALRPLVISPLPSGGSRLAWLGNDGQVHIAALDAADQLTGETLSLPVKDFGDLYADAKGGVVLAARAAKGSGERHCGTLTNLCGPASALPSQHECWDMYLIRFDGTTETWATQLTESRADNPPYLTSPTAAGRVVYLWQAYAHHGRIAFDGSNYAAYYGAAISVSERCVAADSTLATGVNIHQGDRMSVVGPGGALLTGHNSFGWGCSHSGYERVIWDAAAKRFTAVCKTDNDNRIALAPNYATIRAIDLGAANLGDLVLASAGGYWLSTSDAETQGSANADVLLLRFSVTSNAAKLEQELEVAAQAGLNERAPHLAAYGADGLLVAWETSSASGDLRRSDTARKLHVQVRDRATGAAIGEPLAIDGVLGNRYQEFRAFPDGSAAFPAPGSNNQSIKILRVLPCDG